MAAFTCFHVNSYEKPAYFSVKPVIFTVIIYLIILYLFVSP